jgi:hypothetical protein
MRRASGETAAPLVQAGRDTMTKLTIPPLTMLDKYVGPEFQGLYTAHVRVTGGEADHGRASGVRTTATLNSTCDCRKRWAAQAAAPIPNSCLRRLTRPVFMGH